MAIGKPGHVEVRGVVDDLDVLAKIGEQVEAVKLMLRCRLVNAAFRPLPEDAALALDAARHCQNDELISFLR